MPRRISPKGQKSSTIMARLLLFTFHPSLRSSIFSVILMFPLLPLSLRPVFFKSTGEYCLCDFEDCKYSEAAFAELKKQRQQRSEARAAKRINRYQNIIPSLLFHRILFILFFSFRLRGSMICIIDTIFRRTGTRINGDGI